MKAKKIKAEMQNIFIERIKVLNPELHKLLFEKGLTAEKQFGTKEEERGREAIGECEKFLPDVKEKKVV